MPRCAFALATGKLSYNAFNPKEHKSNGKALKSAAKKMLAKILVSLRKPTIQRKPELKAELEKKAREASVGADAST